MILAMRNMSQRSTQIYRALRAERVRLTPTTFAADRHLQEALSWILVARERGTDGGIPAYYDLLRGRWRDSYPETTGYTIPTLLRCAEHFGRPDVYTIALSLADYLLEMRTPEGGVAHWDRRRAAAGIPIVFDTGQVIFGWLAAWRATQQPKYLDAARGAADWLLRIQDSSGAWLKHQHLDQVKVIDTRVALALVELGLEAERPAYIAAARRNLDWALSQQQANGWFQRASFRKDADPFTHTIAYTAEGLLECGLLLKEATYVTAAREVADALLRRQRPDGSLASTYDANWRASARSSCLTGNCQMALLWLRYYQQTGDVAFRRAAQRAIAFVASTQDVLTTDPCVRGAIAGSYPLYGSYERLKYPNWAAKFFIDALLAWIAAPSEPSLTAAFNGSVAAASA